MAKLSKAAEERAAAKKQLESGGLTDRDTYTAKQVATRCGTDSKTMRKFFRSTHSTVEPVGQGGRYEFDARDFPQIKREFDAWQEKIQSRKRERDTVPITEVMETARKQYLELGVITPVVSEGPDEERYYEEDLEPTPEELAALEDEGIELEEEV